MNLDIWEPTLRGKSGHVNNKPEVNERFLRSVV